MTTLNWLEMMDNAGGGFEPLPNGDYDVVITSSEAKKTGTGKDMIVVKAQVQHGPHANRNVWNNFVISPESPGAMSYFFQHMNVFGLTRDYFAQGPTTEQVASALVGRPATFTLSTRDYQGQPRNQVDKIKPSSVAPGIVASPVVAGVPPAPTPGVPPVPAPAPAPAPIPAAPPSVHAPVPPPAPAPEQAPVPQPAAPVPAAPVPTPPQPTPVPAAPPVPPMPAAPVPPTLPTPVPAAPPVPPMPAAPVPPTLPAPPTA